MHDRLLEKAASLGIARRSLPSTAGYVWCGIRPHGAHAGAPMPATWPTCSLAKSRTPSPPPILQALAKAQGLEAGTMIRIALTAVLAFHVGALWPTPEPPGLDPYQALHRARVATGLDGMRREVCMSTIFGEGPNPTDGGVALGLGRYVRASDHGIAHRRAPIGSMARVCLGDLCRWAPVIDRGPYGCMIRADEIHPGQTCGEHTEGTRRWCICAGPYRAREDKYRGCADLAPATARALGHDGMETVEIWTENP